MVDIRGDAEDPFSKGYICPKAHALMELQHDGDRLQKPLVRSDGELREASWEEAYAAAIAGLKKVRDAGGADAVGTYVGNPVAHSLQAMLYGPVLQRALGTRNRYSASSADQLPKMVSAALMFGGGLTIPVPDVDRTDYLLVLGGNPRVSNGSLMTAPDMPGRLDGIVKRGGKVVVLDPRRSETAGKASEHLFVRPGSDAALLLSLVHVWFEQDRVVLGRAEGHTTGLKQVRTLVQAFSPERVSGFVGVDAATLRRIAGEFMEAPRAACYGRIGTTCQRFGSLASWAVDLVNTLSGNLDREGGAMFTRPAANRGGNRKPGTVGGRGVRLGTRKSRVKQLPYMFGEFPVSTLADEILTEGKGQIRGMLTLAGNPLASAPGVGRLTEAFASLDFMVSVDFYLNETTRHADVILPPPAPLERDTYDLALYQLAVRNVAKYSRPALDKPQDQPDEWEILATLARGLMGMEQLPLEQADAMVLGQLVQGEVGADGGRWSGLTAAEAQQKLGGEPGPRRMLDLLLRTGPHGDGFGRAGDGLTLEKLEAQPHGVDLGPLTPQLPDVLQTTDGKINLAPELLTAAVADLEAALAEPTPEMVLIGRRHLRSNNSWLHNAPSLVKGKMRCTLLVNPQDAARLALTDGGQAQVKSAAGSVRATVAVSDEVMPGVVSLPHGWGHDVPGMQLSVAAQHAGTNVNVVSDPAFVDGVSGNAAFNGVPVEVAPG